MIQYDSQTRSIIVKINDQKLQNVRLFIYDLNGRLILKWDPLLHNNVKIDPSSLETGTYVAALEGDMSFYCNKVNVY